MEGYVVTTMYTLSGNEIIIPLDLVEFSTATNVRQFLYYSITKRGLHILTIFDLYPLLLQQIPQPVDLVLELPDELGVGVLVDHGLAHDLLGAVGVPGGTVHIKSSSFSNVIIKPVKKI